VPEFSFTLNSALVPSTTDGRFILLLCDCKLAVRNAIGPLSFENVTLFVHIFTLALPFIISPKAFIVTTPVKQGSAISVHLSLLKLTFVEIEAVLGGAATNSVWLKVLEHAKYTSSLNDLSGISRFHGLEFQAEVFLENQL